MDQSAQTGKPVFLGDVRAAVEFFRVSDTEFTIPPGVTLIILSRAEIEKGLLSGEFVPLHNGRTKPEGDLSS